MRAGEGIIEIGDPEDLEIVVDLLSTDAVKVKAGQKALIKNWGGQGVIEARVSRLEPFGYTRCLRTPLSSSTRWSSGASSMAR